MLRTLRTWRQTYPQTCGWHISPALRWLACRSSPLFRDQARRSLWLCTVGNTTQVLVVLDLLFCEARLCLTLDWLSARTGFILLSAVRKRLLWVHSNTRTETWLLHWFVFKKVFFILLLKKEKNNCITKVEYSEDAHGNTEVFILRRTSFLLGLTSRHSLALHLEFPPPSSVDASEARWANVFRPVRLQKTVRAAGGGAVVGSKGRPVEHNYWQKPLVCEKLTM